MNGVNATMTRFGYPQSCLCDYAHWAVLLRPQQVTLGSLVLACREEATSYSAISAEAHAELPHVVADIENTLKTVIDYEKINYLMLMMVDPHVHFHVIPRYEGEREFDGTAFPDRGWPALPDLASAPEIGEEMTGRIAARLREAWPS